MSVILAVRIIKMALKKLKRMSLDLADDAAASARRACSTGEASGAWNGGRAALAPVAAPNGGYAHAY